MDINTFINDKDGIETEYEKIKDRERNRVIVNGWDLESVRFRIKQCDAQEKRLIENLQEELVESALSRRALYEIRDEIMADPTKKVY